MFELLAERIFIPKAYSQLL